MGLVLLKLLTTQEGYERQPEMSVIKRAFPEQLIAGSGGDEFIEQLFLQSNVHNLQSVFKSLL